MSRRAVPAVLCSETDVAATDRDGRILPIRVASLLRDVWPRHGAKLAARAADTSPETARTWISGRYSPSADTLLQMAAESAELRAELITRLERHGYQPPDAQMARARAAAAGRPAGEAGGPAGPAVTSWDGIERRRGDRRGR